MEDEQERGFRQSKKPWEKDGEVDYKNKAGTAWSHSFLNQKPWHPLSYPNQRRKWIAEQTDAQKQRRAEEISREYAQEQEFLKQAALVSKKEKEKLEMMKAVSFMYVKPPGYNPESAKAAEMADEKKQDNEKNLQDGASSSMKTGDIPSAVEKKKGRPKDVFGRALPTEEQFEVLKNAPRLETGVAGRAKPFGVEIRNVKCLRCGNYGHQSGDRECPLKDAIMPNEESRLRRDDPLTAIQAQTDSSEPLKWELKQKPGLSPPHGGFNPDDANQQIVAEDIFDEYGGFLGETSIPELLNNISAGKAKKKKSKHRRRSSAASDEMRDDRGSESSSENDRRRRLKKQHKKQQQRYSDSESSSSESPDASRRKARKKRSRHKHHRHSSSSGSDDERQRSQHHHRSRANDAANSDERHRSRHRHRHQGNDTSNSDKGHRSRHHHRHRGSDRSHHRRHASLSD